MTISATKVSFDEHTMWVEFSDGRTIGIPLACSQAVTCHAAAAQYSGVEPRRAPWEEIDEDISIGGLLAGRWT